MEKEDDGNVTTEIEGRDVLRSIRVDESFANTTECIIAEIVAFIDSPD